MTVSILGCGWYGKALAVALLAKGIRVKGSTTSALKFPELREAGIEPFQLHIGKDVNFSAQSEFFDCDILVIACNVRLGENDGYLPSLIELCNYISALSIKKVIFISSTGVYGDHNSIVDETTDPRPETVSGQKLFAAEMLLQQQTAFKTTIIRFGGLVGPGRMPGRFLSGKMGIPNGLAPVNLVHLTDCIGITEAIIDSATGPVCINAVSPHHPSRADFYTKASVQEGLPSLGFILDKNKWKLVSSIEIAKLNYVYQVDNWYVWLDSLTV